MEKITSDTGWAFDEPSLRQTHLKTTPGESLAFCAYPLGGAGSGGILNPEARSLQMHQALGRHLSHQQAGSGFAKWHSLLPASLSLFSLPWFCFCASKPSRKSTELANLENQQKLKKKKRKKISSNSNQSPQLVGTGRWCNATSSGSSLGTQPCGSVVKRK